MPKLSTRSIAVAEAIRDRADFDTHGSLMGRVRTPGRYAGPWGSGRLAGADLDQYRADDGNIDYIVWSYSTPIAWHTTGGRWHKVGQKFSITTTKHQGRLYLIP